MAGGAALRKVDESEYEPPSSNDQNNGPDHYRDDVSPLARIRIFGADVEQSHIVPQNFSFTIAA
jgi:hypothetical protein